jgi:phosphatidylglycerophosphate synthase
MAQYAPTSRRPIGEGFRATARFATSLCVRLKIHPDTISYASVVAAAIAAICFWKSGPRPWLLLIAPLFCYLRLWFNMLDGMVALASGKASWRGEILNDLPDRISDVLIFAGAAHSGWMNPFAGYWAAIFALFTAYVGMFGQAVGVQREFSGVMSKPWRMVLLHLGAWITFARPSVPIDRFTILDGTCLLIVAGCLQTIAVRLKRIMAALRKKSP